MDLFAFAAQTARQTFRPTADAYGIQRVTDRAYWTGPVTNTWTADPTAAQPFADASSALCAGYLTLGIEPWWTWVPLGTPTVH